MPKGARYWEKGQLGLAEKDTREAINIDPNCSMWYQNLGFILESEGKYDAASKSWLKSLEINKNWCTSSKTGSVYKLGNYYYHKRDYGKSIHYFDKALTYANREDVGSDLTSLIYLYLSYNYTEPQGLGKKYYDLKKAEELKMKALRLKPHSIFIKTSITKLLVLQNKISQAKRNISEIISEEKNSKNPNPSVYSYLAHIYSLLNDPKDSARCMEKALVLNRGHGQEAEYLLNNLDTDFRQVSSSKEMQHVIAEARRIIKK